MMRRIAATLFVSVVWLACVGDDPGGATTPDAGTGERLAPCFADGKCKEGLVCHPTEKICVTAEEPTDDGGAPRPEENDASDRDAGSDAAVLQCTLPPTPDLPCPDTPCGGVNTCCIDTATGARSCKPSCGGGARYFECDSAEACPSGFRCCVGVESERAGAACEKRVTVTYAICTSDPCTARACRTGSDCTVAGMSTCRLSEVELANGVVSVWGFCAP